MKTRPTIHIDEYMPTPMTLLLILWLAAMGGCVGSFLNVVVYRVPRGLSVVYPGSQCPYCHHVIRGYHNVPVLSWFWLKGRCFDCGQPIAARYALVEATVAGTFVALASGPVAAGFGGWQDQASAGMPWADTEYWLQWAHHTLLLCTLLAVALMELDRPSLPGPVPATRVLLGPLLLGMLIPVGWIAVDQGAVWQRFLGAADRGLDAAWLSAAGGAVAGTLLGLLIWPATDLGPAGKSGRKLALGNLVLVGTFLGSGALLPLTMVTALVHLLAAGLAKVASRTLPCPWSICLFGVTLTALATSDFISDAAATRLLQKSTFATVGLTAAVGLLAIASWAIGPQPVERKPRT